MYLIMAVVDLLLIYLILQTIWITWQLGKADPKKTLLTNQNKDKTGVTHNQTEETGKYRITRVLENGIERVVYTPREHRFDTPILMVHGMWHGAWCWRPWQELFASAGWESIAFSLPGHAGSHVQRPLRKCTLDYYLAFVRDEVERLPQKPVLMGHSMGGALAQWYLKHVNDLPAIVLVAPWVSPSALSDGLPLFLKVDLLGCLTCFFTWNANPLVRSPRIAARKLITEGATMPPQELHSCLGGESALILFQHSPPYWIPPERVRTPTLVVAGERDAVVSVKGLRRTAKIFNADFQLVPGSGHNLMVERTYCETANAIAEWLEKRVT
jgi:pimeloyl-ACP methyl ester carboxylesterase